MFDPCFVILLVCDHLDGEERAGCLTLIVFLMSYDSHSSVTLPRGAIGLHALCYCGISWSYSLAIVWVLIRTSSCIVGHFIETAV